MSERTTILVDTDGAVAIITLNRPQRRNAIDHTMRIELADAISDAMAERAVRALVITGAGGAFSGGGDISTMTPSPAADARPRLLLARRVIEEIWRGPKPVVAAVEGAAAGAGLALALACDRMVAGAGATFTASFVRVGLAGDWGISASLPARIGRHAAKQMMMFGDPVDADTALSLGIVDTVTEAGDALRRATEDAHRLAAGPSEALRTMKAALNAWPRDAFTVLDEEIDTQSALFETADFAEAVDAFATRRTPVFGKDQDC